MAISNLHNTSLVSTKRKGFPQQWSRRRRSRDAAHDAILAVVAKDRSGRKGLFLFTVDGALLFRVSADALTALGLAAGQIPARDAQATATRDGDGASRGSAGLTSLLLACLLSPQRPLSLAESSISLHRHTSSLSSSSPSSSPPHSPALSSLIPVDYSRLVTQLPSYQLVVA